MATSTLSDVLTSTVTTTQTSSSPSSTQRAASVGILEGQNPVDYDPKNPITVFIIQAAIILIFCRLLHWPLSKIRQPRVIAEVIGGILLGPSVMGRIPNFTESIFPTASMPALTLAANLGLVLFLFLVGLEVDLRFLIKHWRVAATVGIAGMAMPFGLGCAIAWGLYDHFRHDAGTVYIEFSVYMLFVGVAMAITAFPVLCRILTELKLLSTPVGVIVLAAGVGNDVVGWILLALCVALVNAGSGITALWVLLVCVGFILFLCFAVRPVFMLILKRTRSLEDGPTQSVVALTLLIALGSAFFTGIIGVHPIFGAFLAGLICPHESGFAIKVTEKIEDLVTTLLLPLYFALSGLSTNLGLLDSGLTWAYVVGVIAVAFCGKMIGGSIAARMNGLVWRECFTIGSLMSCKGLVELIVLNIGLQARILSQRTFTIFVVMALVTTFATTPLTSFLYPPTYQQKLEAWKRGEIDWGTGRRLDGSENQDPIQSEKSEASPIRKIMIYLRLDSLPTTLSIVSCLRRDGSGSATNLDTERSQSTATRSSISEAIMAHGLRLLPLTDRDSSVMKVSEVAEYTVHDPVVNTFLALGALNGVSTSGEVGVAPESTYAQVLSDKAQELSSDLLLLPWTGSGSMSEAAVVSNTDSRSRLASSPFSTFVQETFHIAEELCHVGVVISHSSEAQALAYGYPERMLLSVPFFGSSDDKVAVRFALQLAGHCHADVRIYSMDGTSSGDSAPDLHFGTVEADEKDSGRVKIGPLATTSSEQRQRFLESIRASLPNETARRVQIINTDHYKSRSEATEGVSTALADDLDKRNSLVLLGRNHNPLKPSLRRARTADSAYDIVPNPSCLGGLADKLLLMQARQGKRSGSDDQCQGSLLVMQARQA
ncbi:MAG: hypothetical protein Q9162_003542 [Coniocarpon cinnabarinum]